MVVCVRVCAVRSFRVCVGRVWVGLGVLWEGICSKVTTSSFFSRPFSFGAFLLLGPQRGASAQERRVAAGGALAKSGQNKLSRSRRFGVEARVEDLHTLISIF